MAGGMAYGIRKTRNDVANDYRVVEGVAANGCKARGAEGLGEGNTERDVAAVRDGHRADLHAGPTDLGEVDDNPTVEALEGEGVLVEGNT
jgi:hypothetical protein